MTNKICIIGVYFGQLPNYFPLWLKSASKNSSIDFIIFTDAELSSLPSNVYSYPMTIEQMQRRVTEILGFDACLSSPYKCCDYKPMYGLLFRDYIEHYDYWAHTDFDMIYGDIEKFLHLYDLYQYDKFLPLGHLSFYRNTDEVNRHFMTQTQGVTRHYQRVYRTQRNLAFDEMSGLIAIYEKNGYPFMKKTLYADIVPRKKRYMLSTRTFDGEKICNYPYQSFYWEDGKVYRVYQKEDTFHQEEYIYIHFQKRPNFKLNFEPDAVEGFYITNQGFIQKNGEPTIKEIKRLNPYHGALYEAIESGLLKARKCIASKSEAIKWKIRGEN